MRLIGEEETEKENNASRESKAHAFVLIPNDSLSVEVFLCENKKERKTFIGFSDKKILSSRMRCRIRLPDHSRLNFPSY